MQSMDTIMSNISKFYNDHPAIYRQAHCLTDSMMALNAIYCNIKVFSALTEVSGIAITPDLGIALAIKRERGSTRHILIYIGTLHIYLIATSAELLEINKKLAPMGVVCDLDILQIIDGEDRSKILFACSCRNEALLYDNIFKMLADSYKKKTVFTRAEQYFCIHIKENTVIPKYSLDAFLDYLSTRQDINTYMTIHTVGFMPIGQHKCKKIPNKLILAAQSEKELESYSYTIIDMTNVPLRIQERTTLEFPQSGGKTARRKSGSAGRIKDSALCKLNQ